MVCLLAKCIARRLRYTPPHLYIRKYRDGGSIIMQSGTMPNKAWIQTTLMTLIGHFGWGAGGLRITGLPRVTFRTRLHPPYSPWTFMAVLTLSPLAHGLGFLGTIVQGRG